MKRSVNGERLCDNTDCELIAIYTLVWEQNMFFCRVHANQVLTIAQGMGFPTPANTVRALRPDEIYVGPDDPGEDNA